MHMKIFKKVAAALAVVLVVTTVGGELNIVSAEPETEAVKEITFTGEELESHLANRYGTVVEGNRITYQNQYQDAVLSLGSEIGKDSCSKIVVKVKDQTCDLALKLFDSLENKELNVFYGISGKDEYTIDLESNEAFSYLVIMSMTDKAKDYSANNLGVTIESITFTVKDVAGGLDYTKDNLHLVDRWGGTDTEIDGNKITFSANYKEVVLTLDNPIEYKNCTKITVNVSNQECALGFKAYDADMKEIEAMYGKSGATTYELYPSGNGTMTKFGIMSCDDKASYPASATIEGVSFTVEEKNITIQEDLKNLSSAVNEKMPGTKTGTCLPGSALKDDLRMQLALKHFDSVTCENEMKPDSILGSTANIGEDGYPVLNFSSGDAVADVILAYNKEHGTNIQMRGHVLVWHSQTPEWFFHEDYDVEKPLASKETMLDREENYIKQVMNHFYGEGSKYKDLVYAWDVVNEAIDDGTAAVRTKGTSSSKCWYDVFPGDDTFIKQAFVYANKYAPSNVKLFYNDYNDASASKCKGICELLKAVKGTEGARIDGMGMQAHYDMTSPSIVAFEDAVRAYSAIVDEVQLTELDLKSSNDYTTENQDAEYQKQAYRYKAIYDKLAELNKEDGINISAIVFWGTDDKHSWLQSSNSVGGAADGKRAQCPLLFDGDYQAKPAYWAFVDPSKLEPQIQETVAIEGSDYTGAVKSEFAVGSANVTLTPQWNESGLQVKVQVEDASVDEKDKIEVFAELGNNRSADASIMKKTVERSSATATANGYETVVTFDSDSLNILDVVALDVRVTNGNTVASWNDLGNNQDHSAKSYAKVTLKPYMTIKNGTITVDGKVDTLWDKVEPVELGIKSAELETSATAKLLWDAENLYVLMNVKDANLDVTSANDYEQDSAEIFIDETNAKEGSYKEDDKQYRINCENKHSFNGESCKEENITSQAVKTADGYMIETAIKWTAITPEAGNQIGIDLQINDGKDGSRIGTLNWYDESGKGWSAPSVFGTATLLEEKAAEDKKDPEKKPEVKPEVKPETKPTVETETKVEDTSETVTKPEPVKLEQAAVDIVVEKVEEAVAESVEKVKKSPSTTQKAEQVIVPMGKATVVPVEVLEAAKGANVDVKLQMDGYTWTINGKDIKDTELKDINLEVEVGANVIPESKVKEVAKDNKTIQLSLTHDGDFGFEATLTIDAGKENAGQYGNLYYYNEDGELKFQCSGLIKADGSVDLEFEHASDYVVVIGENMDPATSNVSPDTGDHNSATFVLLMLAMGIGILAYARKRVSVTK